MTNYEPWWRTVLVVLAVLGGIALLTLYVNWRTPDRGYETPPNELSTAAP